MLDGHTLHGISSFTHSDFKTDSNFDKACSSPNGIYAAAGSATGSVFIWDTLTSSIATILKGHHSASVSIVRWNPDGGQVASACKDGKIVMWQ